MGLQIVTDAATEPIDVATAKLWTRIDQSAEDTIVQMLITDARRGAEAVCERYFVPRTVALYLDAFPPGEIELLRPPIIQIDHVKYVASDGTLTTITSTNYTFEQAHGDPPARAWLVPAYGYDWPDTRDVANAVEIQYQCGFSTCPDDVKAYVAAAVAASYGQREVIAQADRIPKAVPFLVGKLDRYLIPST